MAARRTIPPLRQLRARARAIRLVLSDNDGVWTDTGVYYSDGGEQMKRFSIRDGMGVARLRDAGIATGVVSGELSGSLRMRAEKLRLEHVYLGVGDKAALFPEILKRAGLTPGEVAFIGDDVNDLPLMTILGPSGLTGAPADAMPAVLREVHYRCRARGGHGAFREFAEWILALRGSP